MSLKAILFDAGDILYHRDRQNDTLVKFLASHGLPPYSRDAVSVELQRRAYVAEITKEEHHEEFLKHLGISDPQAIAEGVTAMNDVQGEVKFFDGVAETLHRLKALGLSLAIVTNTFNSTEDKLDWFSRIGIEGLWDGIANSCELKISKPDPKIYLAALEPTGATAAEAAFVGHAAYELEAAKALGMTTITFNRDSPDVTADHVANRFEELAEIAGVLS